MNFKCHEKIYFTGRTKLRECLEWGYLGVLIKNKTTEEEINGGTALVFMQCLKDIHCLLELKDYRN